MQGESAGEMPGRWTVYVLGRRGDVCTKYCEREREGKGLREGMVEEKDRLIDRGLRGRRAWGRDGDSVWAEYGNIEDWRLYIGLKVNSKQKIFILSYIDTVHRKYIVRLGELTLCTP